MEIVFKIDNVEYTPEDLLNRILNKMPMPYKYSDEFNAFYVVDDFGNLERLNERLAKTLVYLAL